MITPWDVYWITRLDAILSLAIIALVMLLIATGILILGGFIEDWHEEKWYARRLWQNATITVAFGIITVLLPSTKTAVAIYLIPKIANNEQVQKLPDNAMRFLNGKFEEWINDMADKKKK